MGQGRSGGLDGLLDLADRHLPPGLHQKEEDPETADVRERLEGFDVGLVGRQLRQRPAGYRLRIFKYMELSNLCQPPDPADRGVSQRKRAVADAAPMSCATMNAGASDGRIPAKVSVADRASVTAGLANDVEAVNQ